LHLLIGKPVIDTWISNIHLLRGNGLLATQLQFICKVADQALGWCQVENVISYMQDLIYSVVPKNQCLVTTPPSLLLQPTMHICKVAYQTLRWCQINKVISNPGVYDLLQLNLRMMSNKQCDIIPKWICVLAI